MTLTTSRNALAVVILALFVTAVVPTSAVHAQAPSETDPSTTPVALPFLGELEVWCTDRNPSPNNLCARHHGSPAIDIGMEVGEPIYATGSGVVTEADPFCSGSGACNGGAGNKVVIEHPDGKYSRYLHLNTVSVSVGQSVNTGDRVGTNGLTGHNSGAHLHYDEQFPLGQRVDLGVFIGCVDGAQVEYPAAFGFSDWNDVPYGSIMVNDDFSCHGETSSPVSSGSTSGAVSASIGGGLRSLNAGNSNADRTNGQILDAISIHLNRLMSAGATN